MPSDDHWGFERASARDDEREPSRHTTRRQRTQLISSGTLRAAHEAAEAERVIVRDQVRGTTAEVEYLKPRFGDRKTLRASCSCCGFVGREYGPAEAGNAYDDAKAHVCTRGAS